MRKMCIYAIVCLVNGRRYIGSTVNFNARKRTHLYLLRKSKHKNTLLQSDFIEFGQFNFIFKILEETNSQENLLKLEEIWISKFNNIYNCNIKLASDFNLSEKHIKSFWSKVDIKSDNECWNWMRAKDKDGYGIYYGLRAHRVAYYLSNRDSWNKYLMVRHKCDNSSCCNPQHLELGTCSDNAKDIVRRGYGVAKLTWDIVNDIRFQYLNKRLEFTKDIINYINDKYRIKIAARTINDVIMNKTFIDLNFNVVKKRYDINNNKLVEIK